MKKIISVSFNNFFSYILFSLSPLGPTMMREFYIENKLDISFKKMKPDFYFLFSICNSNLI